MAVVVASLALRVGPTPTQPERLPMGAGGFVTIAWAGLILTIADVSAAPAVQAVAVVSVVGYVTGALVVAPLIIAVLQMAPRPAILKKCTPWFAPSAICQNYSAGQVGL